MVTGLNGALARSETIASTVSAYVLVIVTVLPDLAVDLHSTYTGHGRTGTIAAHLSLARDAYNAAARSPSLSLIA